MMNFVLKYVTQPFSYTVSDDSYIRTHWGVYVEGTNVGVLRKFRNTCVQLLTTTCAFQPLLRDLRQTSTERFVKSAFVHY